MVEEDKKDPPAGLENVPKIPIPENINLAQTLEEALINNPEIMKVVNKFVVRETLKSALFTAFFFLGLLSIINSLKVILGGTYFFDMALGSCFTIIGLVWLIKSLRIEKPRKSKE